MRQKVKENILKKWFALFCGTLVALTMSVSGCNADAGAVSLEEMLAMEQNAAAKENATTEENATAGGNAAAKESTSQVGKAQGEKETDDSLIQTVWVHICGEVEVPGIYELHSESRVYDVVALAGGFTAEADTTYYNLAAMVSDGMKLEIPAKGEKREMASGEILVSGAAPGTGSVLNTDSVSGTGLNTNAGETGLVNINTATAEQLQELPGIGVSRAADIIAYREKQGGFKNTAEIMKVSGIKEAIYEKIKELITVE